MARFLFGRLIGAVVVLWVIITLSFFLMRFAPGSPFDEDRRLPPAVEANKWLIFGMGEALEAEIAGRVSLDPELVEGREYPEGTELGTLTDAAGAAHAIVMPTSGKLVSLGAEDGELVEAGRRLAVVPKPLLDQYLTALGRYARLDFGRTISSDGQRTVFENLMQGLPVSLELGLYSLLFALLFGVSAGLYAGLKQNTLADYAVMSVSMFGISVPTIVSGPIFILVFGLWLGWLPVSGWDTWAHKVLPVLTLGLVYTASFARLTRGGMLEVIRSDYIRTARAKGLDERRVVTRHALKGAILPTVSFLGPAIARIVSGSVVVEKVFGIPGLAEFFITPALNRDYPMVIGVVFLYSLLLVVMNLLVDIAYTVLDPRVSYD